MRSRFSLVAGLFLVSGSTGLLYEVAFSKLLAYTFGATAYAVSAVLSSFMAGLALGAHVGGKLAHRSDRPLVLYGALEIVVAIFAVLSPVALDIVSQIYVGLARTSTSLPLLTALRSGLTIVVVVIPTLAMGATLPILSRLVTSRVGIFRDESQRGHERRVGTLYALNTLGGAAGALASAYAILPAFGVRGTMFSAAAVNVLLGLGAIALGWNVRVPHDEPEREPAQRTRPAPEAPSMQRPLLAYAFASGFLVFAAEVVQTHLLALLIGNSAYAFGLMLAVFLVCLGFGAAYAGAADRRFGRAALPLGMVITALAFACTIPLWDQLPWVFLWAGKHVSSWTGREIVRGAAAFVILVIPTVWMGLAFPLLLRRATHQHDVARSVGRLTVANTVGTVVGSIVTGYAILPALGSQGTLRAIALAFAALGLFIVYDQRRSEPSQHATGGARPVLGLALAAAALAAVLPSWDLARLTNGANVYFASGPPPEAIDFVHEDVHGGVTTVARREGLRTLYTNGKFQGDDGPEMAAQRRFAHFPSLFVEKETRALVIGLGTGATLGTVTAYPYQRIDAAEISPAIVVAAKRFYGGPNRMSLDDPRVRLQVNDGRNMLLFSKEPYDLITMELSSVWFAGASSFYGREFYQLARAKLTPHGILQQWVQLHHIQRQELASIVRTIRDEFSHVALFVGGNQGILVASAAPLRASRARLARLDALPAIQETLGGLHLEDMFGELVSADQELERFVAETVPYPPLSTDDNLYLEYATPKGNVLEHFSSLQATLTTLERYRIADPKSRYLFP